MESENKQNDDASRFIQVRKVTGCGKQRGLQLIVDSHKITSLRQRFP